MLLYRSFTRALANLASLTRLLLAPPVAVAILDGRATAALALLAFAVATDLVDGWMARRFGTTALGSWLDAAADRVLIATVVAALWWTGALATWITATLVLREALIAAAALAHHETRQPVRPLRIGKAHTALAFALMVAAVAALDGLVAGFVVDAFAVAVAATAAISTAAYAREHFG